MGKAVQAAVQERYTAVHPSNEGAGPHFLTQARPANARAVLVTERSTMWDVPADRAKGAADGGVKVDPAWDHCNFTRWTPDLVHYRILAMAETIKRLPPTMRRQYVSIMGSDAIGEMSGPMRSRATPVEITLMDWTLERVCERPGTQRVVIMGMAFGMGVRKIAATLDRMGTGFLKLGKNDVGRMYLTERRQFATAWQSGKAVDVSGRERPLGGAALLDAATVALWRASVEK